MLLRTTWAGLMSLVVLSGCRAEPGVSLGVLAADSSRDELSRFLGAIPVSREEDFGFRDRHEFERATVATPFRMAVPDPAGLPMLLDFWRVPIVVDGEYRALLTVALRDGEMRCTEIGAARLAAELGGVEPEARVLLRVPARGVDFVVAGERAWPLRSAQRLLHLEGDPLDAVALRRLVAPRSSP